MDSHNRDKARQLADDLGWLEDHCRRQPDLAPHAAKLRLAAALTRNVVGPAVDGQPARPLFVAVVGGAGTGKSTVVNFLCAQAVAEANPQAGYTRHPTAYLPAGSGFPWPTFLGFLGSLQRLSEPQPDNLDQDVYQVKRVPPPPPGVTRTDPLAEFVVWDCPDMTTWASTGYVSRLLEVVALADVVVYVASDERYNDEVPTQYLHLLIRAGKAVVCCLTKVREADAPALTEHFRKEVLGKLPVPAGADIPPIPCVTMPQMPAEWRADPADKGATYRVPLLNQLLVLCPTPEAARERTVKNAVLYLEAAGDGLLEVARRDLAELEAWRAAVDAGRQQFEDRYRREFLAGESFRRFDGTREQVMEMLELPGPGRPVSTALSFLRLPYRYARDAAVKALSRPPALSLSERAVCSSALAAWLDGLQAEALRRAGTHPVWKQIAHGFDAGLKAQATERFDQVFRSFELAETDDLDHQARAVQEYLLRHPGVLAAARAGTVGLDLAAVAGTLWATVGPNWSWYHLLLIPLAVSFTRQGVELVVRQAVESHRHRVRDHREGLVSEHLTAPLAAWLSDWPMSAGSTLDKLRQVLARVPQTIRELGGIVGTRG